MNKAKNPVGAPKGSKNRKGKFKERLHGPVKIARYMLSEQLLNSLELLYENDCEEDMSMSEMVEMLIRTNPKAKGFGV